MKVFLRTNFITVLLIASFLGVSTFHMLFMAENMMSPSPCIGIVAGDANCPPSAAGDSFFGGHLSAMQSFFQVLPQQTNQILLTIIALAILLGSLMALSFLRNDIDIFASLRSRLKRLWEQIDTFHDQIGSWLTLLEKRDPIHYAPWCGSKFAVVPIMRS